MVRIGNLELPEDQAKEVIKNLSPRTKNNIIRRQMGLPEGERDDDIVEVGNVSLTRSQLDRVIADMPPERLNEIVKRKLGRD